MTRRDLGLDCLQPLTYVTTSKLLNTSHQLDNYYIPIALPSNKTVPSRYFVSDTMTSGYVPTPWPGFTKLKPGEICVPGSPTDDDDRPLDGNVAIVADSDRNNGVSRAVAGTLGKLGAFVAYSCTSDAGEAIGKEIAQQIRNNGGEAFITRSSPFILTESQNLLKKVMRYFDVLNIDILG